MPPDPRHYPGNDNIPLLSSNEYKKKVKLIQQDPNSYIVNPDDFNPFDYRNLTSVREYELAELGTPVASSYPYLQEDQRTEYIRSRIAQGLGQVEISNELEHFEVEDRQDILRRLYGTPTGFGKDETRQDVIRALGLEIHSLSEIQEMLVENGWTDAEIQDILRGLTDDSTAGRKSRKRSNKKSKRRLKNRKSKRKKSKRTRKK